MLLDTPICNFGWKAPDFTLKDPNGQLFTMSDHLRNGLLIAFICNHCPYVKTLADRLTQDMDLLMSKGIGVLAVMSNDYRDYPEDAPDRMLEFARENGFNFPYLVDEEQTVGRAYGAVCTPDFFGLNANGLLQYRGRLDNLRRGETGARVPELVDAMLRIAETGQGPQDQTPSMGCSIKWTHGSV
ncbi:MULTISPECIES: thioredoxin family protein [unclassified Ruegeria]|uniref:thioredoxin family protein n=1 Tax=unclassified Ruegeria TaxID=2625375 RepID=UPI0014884261|nr:MULTISPECIES: thioredoxin family protein [unclassified Ruegeria]NOD36202.1 redoxin domain-containing protein [Ruegeria sp. HKCCD7296]NOD47391.1 redoxin domain-containing protein [Ruegeria sp. HKCCD5849]NOD53216.1 redoxin domain-containing protein [Ruegeria sp. HKCCD5851]NOD66409.1 redoxin domain-containing protein [Ruegeria sp. HKCCD7303]NOE43595.1 redoxin domain-containing protein [Ruegeria sp. HKCCD7319]